jgi:hypothetical protein
MDKLNMSYLLYGMYEAIWQPPFDVRQLVARNERQMAHLQPIPPISSDPSGVQTSCSDYKIPNISMNTVEPLLKYAVSIAYAIRASFVCDHDMSIAKICVRGEWQLESNSSIVLGIPWRVSANSFSDFQ